MILDKFKEKYKRAQEAYYKGTPIISDKAFDKLEDDIRDLDPEWEGLKKTGTNKIDKKKKVELSHFMPSLGKVYPEAADKWLSSHDYERYMVMSKLDGSSVQANYDQGMLQSLITRGDGSVGQDITFLADHCNLPKIIPHKKPISFRLEAIMKLKTFKKFFKDEAENPRNLVAGILNRKLTKESTKQLKYVDFIVLGVFNLDLMSGLEKSEKWGFDVVSRTLTSTLSSKKLSRLLTEFRTDSLYEMDGLVIADSTQKFAYTSNDKPKWATAFKENLSEKDAPDANVIDVIWQLSHSGRWTPKVQIEPIRLDGVTVKFATVHNAQWMIDRGIGPGSIIKIVRSGGVIPKIVGVVKKSKNLKMPPGSYQQKGVHFRAIERNAESDCKNITRFLATCGVERVKLSTVTRMHEGGMISIEDFARFASFSKVRQKRILKDMEFGDKQSQIIIEEIGKLIGIPLQKAIVGSGVFEQGIGERRLTEISKHFALSKLLTWPEPILKSEIAGIKGFGSKTADEIWHGMGKYRELHVRISGYLQIDVPTRITVPAVPKKGKFKGMVASWTGYRNKEEEKFWVDNGGIVASLSKKTTHLFYNPRGKFQAKVEKAKADGVKVHVWSEFGK